MTKTITCDKCNGLGYFTFEQSGADYAGVNVLRCEVCQCKGVVEVPVTNADHIRSMTDEELSVLLSKPWCENHRLKEECLRFDTDCQACVADWLKQPYGGDT